MAVIRLIFGVVTFGAWVSAVAHAAWALGHLSGKYSLGQMFYGARSFDAESYTPRGQQLQRRFVRSLAVFLGAGVVMVALSALTSSG